MRQKLQCRSTIEITNLSDLKYGPLLHSSSSSQANVQAYIMNKQRWLGGLGNIRLLNYQAVELKLISAVRLGCSYNHGRPTGITNIV